jgi:hypothetical protein
MLIRMMAATGVRNLNYIGCLERNKKYLKDDSVFAIRPRSILRQSGQEHPVDAIVSHPKKREIHNPLKTTCLTKLLAMGIPLTQYDVEIQGQNGSNSEHLRGGYGYKEAYSRSPSPISSISRYKATHPPPTPSRSMRTALEHFHGYLLKYFNYV